MPREFQGKIELDVRDSEGDWDAFLPDKAPEGAPNVLVVLFDDTGQAAWSPYGGRIQMPTLDRLAANGLTYSQWHTTALCSPTRSTFLTGRNHHLNGYASISESASGFPGYSSHIPKENGTIAQVLRDAGWSTYWVGKNHNIPIDAWGAGGSKKEWPLALGYDRFYGFVGGETNNWFPSLAEDNHYIDAPYSPDEGYHLSKDLADKAMSFIRDSQQSDPTKPWYLWFCPGANHAPHHAPQEYIDKYKGVFDDGYEAYREWVLPRMIERGLLPEGTELTPLNPMEEGTFNAGDHVRPWAELDDQEKALFSRMAEVYAGFSEYTDAQVGRIVEYLEESGQLENTLIIYAADNGASGEGSPNGSVNEGKYFNGYPDTLEENLKYFDVLGSPDTYNHYPTGWAAAFSTPYRMFKRYVYQGGIADPLVISWPKGIAARGEVRTQYHHSTDIVPTILEACGVPFPEKIDGIVQHPLSGVSMAYSFDAEPTGPTEKQTQYYEMFGNRGIWHEGWKAVTEHGPISGIGDFEKDRWQLFHTEVDRSEAHDLAAEHPEKLEELKALWLTEAKANNVLPLNDLNVVGKDLEIFLKMEFQVPVPPSGHYVYYPGTSEIAERNAANTHAVSFRVLAQVETTAETTGVIFAQGSRFGGHALFVQDGQLHYVHNFLGIESQKISGPMPAPGKHVLGIDFAKERPGDHHEFYGPAKLYVNEEVVAEKEIRTMTGHYALCGEGLCIGYDSGDSVSAEDYSGRFDYTGGEIKKVIFDVADDAYIDVEAHLAAALARD